MRITIFSPCGRGERRDTEIDPPIVDLHAEAAILGQPLLRDVQGGQDLDARDERPLGPFGEPLQVLQEAVHAAPDADPLVLGSTWMSLARISTRA